MKGFALTKGRIIKAKKIKAVLTNFLNISTIEGKKILDAGCGNGEIAAFFSKKNEVFCVDIVNQLDEKVKKHVKFIEVKSEVLPFPDDFFDIIISNHVIEHVRDQELYIKEIRRCLKKHGVCYFATPNKNFLVEPHYRIPLIHYLPLCLFLGILKILGIYNEDIYLLSYGRMKKLFYKYRFKVKEYTVDILKKPRKYNLEIIIGEFIPRLLLDSLRWLMPTNIFILKK